MNWHWLFHKWNKWESYTADMVRVNLSSGKEIKHVEERQFRTCQTCGRREDTKVAYDI